MPILLYGSEIWGFEDLAQIETFFCRYCKELLGLHKRTPNCMVYGEIGKNRLAKNVTLRMLMFWYRLVHSKMSKVANVLYNFQYALSVRQENSSDVLLRTVMSNSCSKKSTNLLPQQSCHQRILVHQQTMFEISQSLSSFQTSSPTKSKLLSRTWSGTRIRHLPLHLRAGRLTFKYIQITRAFQSLILPMKKL